MGTIDLTKLEDYIVIPLAGGDVKNAKDLRELDQNFGNGVAALWSDAVQGILAFAFFKTVWNEDDARRWVAQAKSGDVKEAAAEDAQGKDAKGGNMPYKSMEEVNPAIKGVEPAVTLAQANTIAAWADAMEQAEDGPDNPWAVAIANFKKAYEVQNGAWVKREAEKAASALYAFDSILADGTPAQQQGDGLLWKEVIKPGAWFKMDTGAKIEVTPDIINETYRAFSAGLPRYISVPADSHHSDKRGAVPAELNRGFVKDLKIIDGALFGGFKLTDPQISAAVQEGSIADCSVYLQPEVVHPSTGEKFKWVLRHVLLTNNPLVQDLRAFGDLPADGDDANVTVFHYRQAAPEHIGSKEETMPEEKNEEKALSGADEILLTGDAAREYAVLAGLGLTADEIKTLAAQRDAIAAQAEALRTKAREMEVIHIVKALEGADEHRDVVQVSGYRHYPVIVSAVEKALREAPEVLALDADDNGVSPLDAAVLRVVNALPAEARIKATDEPAADKRAPVAASNEVTDAQLDMFLKSIG